MTNAKKININENWFFIPDFKEEYINENISEKYQKVTLPHTNKELPYSCFDERDYAFISTYKRTIKVDKKYSGKRIFIRFEGAMVFSEVFINGKLIGNHKGGYTPFEFEITDKIKFGVENTVTVKLDSTERSDIPPHGNVVDYLTYGGIYRDVNLFIYDDLYIENAFIKTENVLNKYKDIVCDVYINKKSKDIINSDLTIKVMDQNKLVAENKESIKVRKFNEKVFIKIEKIKGLKLWSTENPKLYTVKIEVKSPNSEDSFITNIGFREAKFTPTGFYLNGEKRQIVGLNRHQSFPYVGYAMPERVQRKDADILKYDLGLNMVRTSHYPQSNYFLNRCDEIGLLVFEEIPGWQHIGDEKWKEVSKENVREMIRRDWNHPSIVLWGVRINESGDDNEFYIDTNKIAHSLDKTRQTGGVRCIEKSEFLEDVYTMNDFIHSGGKKVLRNQKKVTGLKKEVPYMVTEYNGHMYSTKRFDNELKVIEHTERHLRVVNKGEEDPNISGTIGWCAFDYNTHKDFGSGDKICHHGVMDMFRIPKMAAAAYSSQIDKSIKPVMIVGSLMSKGDRDQAFILPIYVYTNCDYVKVFKNGEELGKYYPKKSGYKALKHPPVVIYDTFSNDLKKEGFKVKDRKTLKKIIIKIMKNGMQLSLTDKLKMATIMKKYKISTKDVVDLYSKIVGGWGTKDNTYEFVGYIDNKEVIRKKKGDSYAYKLIIEADDKELKAIDYDATRVVFKLVDQYDNILPYINEYIKFKVEGPGELIGPEKTALIGGCIGTWIKTTGEKGTINIKGKCSRFESEEIEIEVK